MRIKGRIISKGKAEGAALVTSEPITFLGGVDARSGKIVERGHELEGEGIAGKILVFPRGKGSTVGSYVIYGLKKAGLAPAAIVNEKAEEMVATGAIVAGIPMIDSLTRGRAIKNGMRLLVNAEEGYVEILSNR